MMLRMRSCPSPIGVLRLVAEGEALTAILWPHESVPATVVESPDDPLLRSACSQIGEYFGGARTTFTLPLDPRGTTFQRSVWEQLLTLSYGVTQSYGEVARRLGQPTASRAVGAAIGRNPLPLLIPCHRVVGSSGKLVGFAGGVEAKRHLLTLEGVHSPALLFASAGVV